MKLSVRRLRSLIRESLDEDDVGGPTLDWGEWYAAFEAALVEAGHESLLDVRAADFITSGSGSQVQLERVVHEMWKQGLSPEDAVSQLDDRRSFERTWGGWMAGDRVN